MDDSIKATMLIDLLEIQLRTLAINKPIIAASDISLRYKDLILLSMLSTIPFEKESVPVINAIFDLSNIYDLESICESCFDISYIDILTEYSRSIDKAYDAIQAAHTSTTSKKDRVFFEQSTKLS